MSSKLAPCPYCIANVRKDKLDSHISKVHYKQTRAQATNRDTGYYRSAHTPQRAWSCDREYYREHYSYRDYDVYNWSDADYYYYPTSPRSLRDTHSHRSNANSLSGMSDFQSRAGDYLADSSDTESLSSNISHGKLGGDDSWIVFSTPTSVVKQRRCDGFMCPVPQCRKKFAEVEDVIKHAHSIHCLERCPQCKGVNLKYSRALADHMQEIHQNKKTKNIVISSSRPSNSGGISSTTHVIPRKEDKLVSDPGKLQTNKDSAKSNPIKPLNQAMTNCGPVSDKGKPKTESKEITKIIPSKSIFKSKEEGQPSTNTSNKAKLETSKKLSKITNEKQQNNYIKCSPTPVTAVIKSKQPSRPNTPNTAINISDIVKKDLKTLGISAPRVNEEELNGNIISNGTDKIDTSTDEANFINSHKDPELEKDINFQFINTDGLIGYSLNIR